MSDLRLHVKGKDDEEISYAIHYGMDCRLVTAITRKLMISTLCLKAPMSLIEEYMVSGECMDSEENYRKEQDFTQKHGFTYVAFKPKPSKEPIDAGIIEIYFPEKLIISNQSGITFAIKVLERLGDIQAIIWM